MKKFSKNKIVTDIYNYDYLKHDLNINDLDNYETLSSNITQFKINTVQNHKIENPIFLSKVHVIQCLSGTGAIYYEPEYKLAKLNNTPQIIILSNHEFTQ